MIGGAASQSEHQDAVERVLRRAEISRLTRNLKSKLAIATLKTQGHSPLTSPTSTEHQAKLPFKTTGSNSTSINSLSSEPAPRKRAKTLEGNGQPLTMTPTGMPAPSRAGRRTDPRRFAHSGQAQGYQGSPLRNSVRPLSHPGISGAYASPIDNGSQAAYIRSSPLQSYSQTPTKMPPQPHLPTPGNSTSPTSVSTQDSGRLLQFSRNGTQQRQIPTLDVTPPPGSQYDQTNPAHSSRSAEAQTSRRTSPGTESEPLPAEPSTPPPPGRANPKTPVRTPMRTPRSNNGRDRLDRDGANLLLYLATSPGRGSTTPRTPRTPDFNLNDYLYLYSPSPGRPGVSTHGTTPLAVSGTPKRILGIDDLNRDIFGSRTLGTPGNSQSSKLLGPPQPEQSSQGLRRGLDTSQ